MKTLSYHSYLFLLILFWFSSCEKDNNKPEKIAAATQEGKNKFGCYVNGELFFPKKLMFGSSYNAEQTDDGLYIFVYNDLGNIKLQIQPVEVGPVSFCMDFELRGGCRYKECFDGAMTITKYDQTNKIISGTFSFTAKAFGTCGELKVTEGRFDFKYK